MKHRVEPFIGPVSFPAAHVLLGSEVVKTFVGLTKKQAIRRAGKWAKKADKVRLSQIGRSA